MPRSFFSRVFLQGVLVLAALLATGGFALDRFLSHSEIERLGDQVRRFALLARENAALARDGGQLQQLVVRMGEETGIRFSVIDRTGKVVAESHFDPAAMANHADHPEVAVALAGGEGRNLRRSKTLGVEMLYVALPGEPIFRAALPVSEVQAVLAEVRRRMALAAIPASAVALFLAYVLARSLTARVQRMKGFAQAIERGEYDSELPPGGDDELADMERALIALRNEIRSQVQALRRDKETLVGLVEGLPHAVLLFDGQRRLVVANGIARALLRLSAEGMQGLSPEEVVRNPKILEALETAGERTGGTEPFRLEWPDPPCRLDVEVHLLPGEGGAGELLAVLRDVTRETHLERVRSDFVVNLSHELRTPLTAIRGFAETLAGGGVEEPETRRKFLESIRRNALRLESLLHDISDLARAETGAAPAAPAPFDARDPVRLAADLFAVEARNKGIALRTRLPGEAVALVSDAGKVEQILVNLAQNAVRYTPPGGTVELSVEETAGGARYAVGDTGIGIPAADLPRVTERFYRVDPGRSRAEGGTGLGLSIVKHLTEQLGGTLEIRSAEGKGTTAAVTLPSLGPR